MPAESVPSNEENAAEEQLNLSADPAETQDQPLESDTAVGVSGELDSDGREDSTAAVDATAEEPAWKKAFHEAGFNDIDTIDDVADRSIQAIQLREQQNRQLSDQVSQLNNQLKFYQDQMGRQGPPQSAPQAEESAEQDLFDKLQKNWVDPHWARQFVEFDENGQRQWVGNPDEDTRKKVDLADQNLRQFQELFTDPNKFVAAIDKRIEQAARTQFDNTWTERQTQAAIDAQREKFTQENESWLYEHDPATGQVVFDPVKRAPVFSQEGNQVVEFMLQADALGITRFDHQIEYAMTQRELNQLRTGVQPQQTAPAVQDAAEQRRREMLGRTNAAQPTSSVNGVAATPTEPTGYAQMSVGEKALARFKQQTGAA